MIYNKLNKGATPNVKIFCSAVDCEKVIPKLKQESWARYAKRKFCSKECVNKETVRKDDGTFNMGSYIAEKSRNGRMMADFNLGVLRAVERVKVDKSVAEGIRGVICSYKGVPVTGDVVKTANNWLMEQWKGRPGQRLPEAEEDNRSFEEKFKAMEYNLKEMGYKLVKIDV